MRILGAKLFGHDSAICLIDTDKQEIFAVSTERITRIKHDNYFIEPVLEKFKIKDFDYICHSFANFDYKKTGEIRKKFYPEEIEFQKLFRKIFKPKYIKDLSNIYKLSKKEKIKILLSRFKSNPWDVIKFLYYYKWVLPRINKKDFTPQEIERKIKMYLSKKFKIDIERIKFYDHHLCHAIGAYYTSPFVGDEVISLTIDGHGDGFFSKLYIINNKGYKCISESESTYIKKKNLIVNTASIGHIYTCFTIAMDLVGNSDEGKVEALAAFGKKDDLLYNKLRKCVKIEGLKFVFDVNEFQDIYNLEYLKNERKRIGNENFCATVQSFLEDIMVEYLNKAYHKFPQIKKLCLSGGVAANIIMSLNIYERTPYKEIHVMPAMADDGTALGSAILCTLKIGEDVSWISHKYFMPYYGNEISSQELNIALQKFKNFINWEYIGKDWYKKAALDIFNYKIIGVVNGKMEFGPRALGNRSILANPTEKEIKDKINAYIKRRPWYQPFCPSILEEERERLFERSFSHKHMAIAFRVKKEFWDKIPAAIHIDGTARPQFVEKNDNSDYYYLLKEVKKLIGFGVVINTSFNLHGRTIVATAEDALRDFIDCNMDVLYINGYRITRKNKN